MATTTGRGSSVKRREVTAGYEAQHVVRDQVEELARAGARQMLLAALEDEVNAYLQRDRYQRQAVYRGYRNGTTPRRLTLGSGTASWLPRGARPSCGCQGRGARSRPSPSCSTAAKGRSSRGY